MSAVFPQMHPEKNSQITKETWDAFVQMELPWPVKGALVRETVGSAPSPASGFLRDIKQILPSLIHRALKSKEFLPMGANHHAGIAEVKKLWKTRVLHSVKVTIGRATFRNEPGALSAWVCCQ